MTYEEAKELDSQYYMNTYGPRMEALFTHGQGCTLYGADGKTYTDFLAGIAVNLLGYNHPGFVKAVSEQLAKLPHCSNYFYSEPQARLAQRLVELSPADRVFFANSGGEANEGAVKLARRYFHGRGEDRYEVISLTNSFHGRTLAMVAATGQERFQVPYAPLPAGFTNIAAGDIDALRAAVNPHTAAILLETIQGEGGIVELGREYLQAVAALCKEQGLLLIIDEVQTGMGRTGKLFSFQHFGIEPDIFTLAKGLGGGIPIGAILAKESVAAFGPSDHGTTFGGNPLACAAGLAVLDAIEAEGLTERAAELGGYFKGKLNAIAGQYTFVKEVRGMGLMLGMELDEAVHAKDIMVELLRRGYVIVYANRNTLRFLPPLIISRGEIDGLCAALNSILSEVTV